VASQTVLVTGGSGFLGGWTIVCLLKRGYRVRSTLRSLKREDSVRAELAAHSTSLERLDFVQADLLADDGWDEAVGGCDYVLHVASPVPVGEYKGQDLIPTARDGTLRVLKAAVRADVKRIVLTSSVNTVKSNNGAGVIDETMWSDPTSAATDNYSRSKVIAEQEAWKFMRASGIEDRLTTILPSFMQGPVLGRDVPGSVLLVQWMLVGKLSRVPRIGMLMVDVRDVADLHVLAMTAPEAAGQRLIATSNFLAFADIAKLLKDELGERAVKVSTKVLPNALLRVAGLINADARSMANLIGQRSTYSARKAERLLGWIPRPSSQAVLDGANSLLKSGLV
jgi:dihydroflavonol-4-reductase